MENLNLYDIYNRKRRMFGINDSPDFQQYFVDSVNLVYSELNEKVFESNLLERIGSFDDVIDTRLKSFTDITFDSDADSAISNRDIWSWQVELEQTRSGLESETLYNSYIETITDSGGATVIEIEDNELSFLSASGLDFTATIPELDEPLTIKFISDKDGNRLQVNGESVEIVYNTGDSESKALIEAVASHAISGVSGFELLRTKFFSGATLVYDFDINDSSSTLTDLIAGYEAIVTNPLWETRYIYPSTALDFRYRSSLEMGLDYHLQDGGQYGLESEPERERKWYGRGIRSARQVYQQQTTYKSPLNISGD